MAPKSILLIIGLSLATLGAAQPYKRIVSLAPSLTKNIYYLGAQDKLVGCTSYCTEALADQKPMVASAVKPNIEKIVSLRPDLVVVTSLTDAETLAMLKKFGIRTEMFASPKDFDGVCQQFARIGTLTGKTSEAAVINKASKTKVDSLQRLCKWPTVPNVFFQIGARPIFAVTPGNFMDDYIRKINARNVASDLQHGTISRETVLARQPDVIFITTMGLVGEEEKKAWEDFTSLPATRKKQIFIIDSDMACSATPIDFTNTMEKMVQCLKKK